MEGHYNNNNMQLASECVVAKQAQWWPLGSRMCGNASQGYTAIRHARQNDLMHILCTFN